jgi:cytoskeletal protein CcmA (bactofilin family)
VLFRSLRLQRLDQADRLALLGLASRAPAASAAEREIPAVGEVPAAPAPPEAPDASEIPDPDVPEEPAAPEVPEESEVKSGRYTGERVNIGGGVTVAKGERAEQVVAIGGPARVEGEVEQDVVSVGSSAHVDGKVGGEVVSVGGTVYLGPHAEIDGNVTSVGGSIQREEGAKIHGNTSEVALFPMLRDWSRGDRRESWRRGWSRHDDDWSFFGGFGDFVGSLTGFVLLSLLACLVILIARQPLERVLRQLTAQPWQSAGVGFAAALTFWPLIAVITVLLAITVVGCLLIALYPFLFFFLALVALVGFTAVAVRVGQALQVRFNLRSASLYSSALIGVLVLCIGSILASLLDWIGGPLGIISFFFGLFGVLAQGVAWIVGFGAVILARFGTSPGYWPKAGPPVTPFVPAVPDPPADSASPYGFPDQPTDPVNPAAPVPGSEDLPLSHIDPPASEEADRRPEPPPAV